MCFLYEFYYDFFSIHKNSDSNYSMHSNKQPLQLKISWTKVVLWLFKEALNTFYLQVMRMMCQIGMSSYHPIFYAIMFSAVLKELFL